MTDTTVVEERPDEPRDVPPENISNDTPADTPASPTDEIDRILSEWDQAVKPQESLEPEQIPGAPSDPLADYNQLLEAQGRNGQLQGEVNALKRAEYERQEQQAFDKYAGEIQSRLPKHLPDDYAKASMLAAAAQDSNLLAAWRYRNLDRNVVEAELNRLEALHKEISLGPDHPKKADTLRELERQGWQAGLALNSREILRRAERDLIKRAEEHKVYDQDIMQTRFDIAQAMRGASAPVNFKEPPPRLGNMTDREYREYLKQFGISGF
jgi:hypothetical protein